MSAECMQDAKVHYAQPEASMAMQEKLKEVGQNASLAVEREQAIADLHDQLSSEQNQHAEVNSIHRLILLNGNVHRPSSHKHAGRGHMPRDCLGAESH